MQLGAYSRIKPRAGKVLLRLAIATGLLIAVGIGYLTLQARLQPDRVRMDVIERLSKWLPAEVATFEVGSAEVALGESRLTLREVSLTTPGPQSQRLVHVEEIVVIIDGTAILGGFHPRDITLHGLSVSLLKNRNGSWAHSRVLAWLDRHPHGGGESPTIRIQNAEIIYRDARITDLPDSFALTGIDVTVTSGSTTSATRSGGKLLTQFSAVAKGTAVTKLSCLGTWHSGTSELSIDRLSAELDLAKSHELPLPRAWRQSLNAAELRGRAEILGSAVTSASDGLVSADMTATIVEGAAVVPELGFTFDYVSALVHFDGDTARLEDFRGLTPAGSVQAQGALQLSIAKNAAVELKGGSLSASCPRISLTTDLLGVLPEPVAEFLILHQIRGGAALSGTVTSTTWPPEVDDITLELRPLGLRFRYDHFPFPVELLEGSVTLRDGDIRVDPPIFGTSATSTVTITGGLKIEDAGGRILVTDGSIRLQTQDFTASEQVAESFLGKGRAIWDSFDPVGKVDADLSIQFGQNRLIPRVHLTLLPKDLRIRYGLFPITVERLRGALDIDFEKSSVVWKDVTGRHRQRLLTTSGQVNFGTDRSLEVSVSSDSVSLNDELLAALPQDVRVPLIENRASGEARVEVVVRRSHDDERPSIDVEVEIRRLVIDPKSFPFPLVLAGGLVKVGDQRISIAGLRSSENSNPNFDIDGTVDLNNERVDVTLTGSVNRLVFDDRLYGMFQPSIRKQLRNLNLQGTHNFEFKTDFNYRAPKGVPRKFSYEVWNVRTKGSGVDVGVRFRDIVLDGHVKGSGVIGEYHELEGVANVHSARFNRLEFGSARVVFVYGKQHPAVLSGQNGETMEGSTFVVDKERFGDRLTENVARHTLQVLLDPADLYGGQARGFLSAELIAPGELRGDYVVEGLDIGKSSRSIHGNESIGTSGTGKGRVSFRGNTGDPTTIVGEGDIQLKGTKFVDLPTIFSAVTKISKKPQADYGFSTLTARYSIANGKFHTDPTIALEGTLLQLLGKGTMDFYGVLNLNFVPTPVGLGPFIEPVIKRLANVEVRGPIENPSAELRVLD